MVTHSSILAWEIPWTEEPGGLQSMGWQRISHDLVSNKQHTIFHSGSIAPLCYESQLTLLKLFSRKHNTLSSGF